MRLLLRLGELGDEQKIVSCNPSILSSKPSTLRPDLLKYATTNNKGTTGDGHKLALAVGAKAVDLDDVQVASLTGHVTDPPLRRQICSCTPADS